MLIVGLDIETTGLLKPDQKVVELYAGLWDMKTQKLVDEFYTRINPMRSIGIEAERVHGITAAMVASSPIFASICDDFVRFVRRGAFIVAHNGEGFDGPFLDMELGTLGRDPIGMPIYDTMLQGRWAKPDGSVPNLGALCFACDVPYGTGAGKAHAADYDVAVMMQCFFRGLDWGFFKLDGIVESHAVAA